MKNVTFSILAMLALAASTASAHQGHHHEHEDSKAVMPVAGSETSVVLNKITEDYSRRVSPLFQKSCMDCHSNQTRFPWYYKIPGIKQFIDSDISEAKHHLDFSNGYPFRSHATPIEDLDAITESLRKDTMPPFFYRLMHSGSSLNDGEKETVLDWAEKSKRALYKQ